MDGDEAAYVGMLAILRFEYLDGLREAQQATHQRFKFRHIIRAEFAWGIHMQFRVGFAVSKLDRESRRAAMPGDAFAQTGFVYLLHNGLCVAAMKSRYVFRTEIGG